MKKIELLYFEGCPSWQVGLRNLKTALEAGGMEASIELVLVSNNLQAAERRFLGSPSFRLDGQDMWPEARKEFYLGCRVYPTPGGLKGAPTVEMLRDKLRQTSK
jgi:hypothetical protein